MTILEVQVSDEVAHRMAKEMQARDEHPWAAAVVRRDPYPWIVGLFHTSTGAATRGSIREEIGAAIGELEVRGII